MGKAKNATLSIYHLLVNSGGGAQPSFFVMPRIQIPV